MTNDEWLKSLEPAELKAWFDAEHDGYREKLGRAVDAAWEIVQLMDDESCGAAGSERSSCEVYVLNDGTYQCGNCGAIIAGVVAEGESEDGDWA